MTELEKEMLRIDEATTCETCRAGARSMLRRLVDFVESDSEIRETAKGLMDGGHDHFIVLALALRMVEIAALSESEQKLNN